MSICLEASGFCSLLWSDILSALQVPACKVSISYAWEQGLCCNEGCIDPTHQLNQMFKYLCRNDHCHLICWLVLSYLFVEYSIIYGEIPGGSSANATSNWICWFLKVRWKVSIIIRQMRWWWHQVALYFKCKNLYSLITAVCHHCGRWVKKTINHNVHFQACQYSNAVSEEKKKRLTFPNQQLRGEKNLERRDWGSIRKLFGWFYWRSGSVMNSEAECCYFQSWLRTIPELAQLLSFSLPANKRISLISKTNFVWLTSYKN